MSDDNQPVCVFSTSSLVEADVAGGALDAAGIPFSVLNQSIHQVYGGAGITFDPVQLWVPSSRAEEARRLLSGEGRIEDGDNLDGG